MILRSVAASLDLALVFDSIGSGDAVGHDCGKISMLLLVLACMRHALIYLQRMEVRHIHT